MKQNPNMDPPQFCRDKN